jgi:RNA polymerase sigma-70 factor (ECF subfamily)
VTSEPGTKEAPVSPEEFLELVQQYDLRLRALAFRLLGDRDRMDDALQDAYLKAFRAFPGFRSEASVGTWLYRIVYNTCIDEIRRSARANLVPIPDIPDPVSESDPAEVVFRAEDLSTALRELGDQDRALVLLVDADGLSYREAAEVLDLPLGTVASRLHRTRAALRHSLDDRRGVR